MEIIDLRNRQEFLKEVMELEHDEWSSNPLINREDKINKKIDEYFESIDDDYFCKLILVNDDKLIGFISIFPNDCYEELDLYPWYATMFVKKKYRGKGYSKLLNEAILKEAKRRGIKSLYLKTELDNYYEKFGAKFIKKTNSGEKIFMFEI